LVEWKTCPTRRTLERLKELRRQPWSPRSTVRAAADLAWRFDTISASLEILGELASREEPLPIDVRRHVLVAEVGGPAGARRLDPKLDDETIGPETLNSLFDAQRAPACSLPDIGLSDASDTPFDDKQLRGLISLVFWIRTISAALADPDAWLPLLALPPTGALPSAALLEASRLLDTPLELAELAALLERLQALPEGPDDLAMPLALTQLPRTPRAFGRLAPPERALVRDAIRLHHGPESHWLTDLPPEPS
jgi:hypothetical protein